MLKRFFILLFSVVLLTGCVAKKDKEQIVFLSWGSVTEVIVLKKIISEYESENPDVHVQFLHVPQNYFQKLHLLFASRTEPDVVFINNLYLPLYANFLEDLSPFIQKEAFYNQAIDGLSVSGNLLAVPRDISSLLFYVNLDKVQKFSQNLSMDELLKLFAEAKESSAWAVSLEEDMYYVQPYLSYFGEILDEKFSPLDSEGLKFYIDLRDKYAYAPRKSQIGSLTQAQMFLSGDIAFYLSGRWMWPKISEKADFNWAVLSFPLGKNPLPCDFSGWAVTKNSKCKTQAIKFVKYLSSKESLDYFAKTGLVVPARIESALSLNNKEHNEYVFLDVINKSKPTYVNKDYKKIVDLFNSKCF